jgi:hypothetical protein
MPGSESISSGAAYRNRTDDLRITRVFSCVARRFGARLSFMFAGCCWRQSLVIDGGSGTSRGQGSVMRRPGLRWPMAVVTCGTAGWPSLVTSSVGLLHDLAYVRQARSRCLPCYPGVAVTTLDRPPERARSRLRRRQAKSFEFVHHA